MSDGRNEALRRSDAQHWRRARESRFETRVPPPPTIIPDENNMPAQREGQSDEDYLLSIGAQRPKRKWFQWRSRD